MSDILSDGKGLVHFFIYYLFDEGKTIFAKSIYIVQTLQNLLARLF